MASPVFQYPRFQQAVDINIFAGPCFSSESSEGLSVLLSRLFPNATLHRLKAVEELQLDGVALRNKTTLLVMPGARDISAWNFSLAQKESMERLFALGRLKWLGVCAGAYYPAETVVYQGAARQVTERIHLFKGSCVGPYYTADPLKDLNLQPGYVWVAEQIVDVVLHQGGVFVPAPSLQEGRDYKPLAYYAAQSQEPLIAALACSPDAEYQNYNALLVGPHLEYEAPLFEGLAEWKRTHAEFLYDMAQRAEASALARLQAMHYFLSHLGFQ